MPIDESTLRGLKRLSTTATAEVLQANHAQVLRIARGLTGRSDTAARIVRMIMKRAAQNATRWHHEDAPQRWFLHHTVLACRRFKHHEPDPDRDELVTHAGSADPAYVAFIRALRQLPYQQREAFLLHHGESLNDRLTAVGMDLSTTAAETHLTAATHALQPLAGDRMKEFTELLKRAYHDGIADTTADGLIVDWAVTRYVLPRKVWRIAIWLIMLATIVVVGLSAWEFRGKIDW